MKQWLTIKLFDLIWNFFIFQNGFGNRMAVVKFVDDLNRAEKCKKKRLEKPLALALIAEFSFTF